MVARVVELESPRSAVMVEPVIVEERVEVAAHLETDSTAAQVVAVATDTAASSLGGET
jgi:hypothetical protein